MLCRYMPELMCLLRKAQQPPTPTSGIPSKLWILNYKTSCWWKCHVQHKLHIAVTSLTFWVTDTCWWQHSHSLLWLPVSKWNSSRIKKKCSRRIHSTTTSVTWKDKYLTFTIKHQELTSCIWVTKFIFPAPMSTSVHSLQCKSVYYTFLTTQR